jgi:hypothetical protein
VLVWTTAYWKDITGILYKDVSNTPAIVPGTDANSHHPAVSSHYYGIVWQQDGVGIQYRAGNWSSWYSLYTIAVNTPYIVNVSPAMDASNMMGYIAWEERNLSTSQASIKFRTIDYSGILSPVSTIYTCPLTSAELSPSLNCQIVSNDTTITIIWSLPTGGSGCAMYTHGKWNSPFQLSASGKYASIGLPNDSYNNHRTLVVSKSSTGPPYRLQIDTAPITSPQQTMISISRGWNLVSCPRVQANYAATSVFPGALGALFKYNPNIGDYAEAPDVPLGIGVWVYYQNPTTISVVGSSPAPIVIACKKGWNMIGSREVPILPGSLTVDAGMILGSLFKYDPGIGDYAETTGNLEPGMGAWVYVTANCNLTIP